MNKSRETAASLAVQIPILITSSITPHDTGVKLSDPEKRLFHAIESIEQWIRVAPESRFVLCDGSGFDFEPIVRQRFPNTRIECIYFNNDKSKIALHGRGYGEGEIIKFSLNHSQLLRESVTFAKCSSKLWVENYPECLENWQTDCLFSGVFKNSFSIHKPIEIVQVDTRFYLSNVHFYLKNFVDAHQKIGKAVGFGLEDSFLEILLEKNKRRYLFSSPPIIRGVGGGTGKYYKDTRLRVLKERLRVTFVRRSQKFRDLFVVK